MTNPTITTGSNLTDEQWLNNAYLNTFGRTAVTGDADTGGGAQYWLDQMASDPTGHSRANVLNALQQSSEGQSFATDGVVRPGGVNRGSSTYSQGVGDATSNPNFNAYTAHFQPGGALAGSNSANVLNNIAANSFLADASGAQTTDNVAGGYFQFADSDITNPANPANPADPADPADPSGNWWESFDDIDAFKDALGLGDSSSGGGMNDFMQFMMFMNMMRPQGGGYGGSQYGYGGLNPGGVMSAYNPLDNFQGYMDAFNTLRGGTTTNTGTATATA